MMSVMDNIEAHEKSYLVCLTPWSPHLVMEVTYDRYKEKDVLQ